MSKKANPTVIGIFVIGAIGLLVTGVLVFSSGKFFSKTIRYAAFFDSAVSGLSVGSSVNFKGVKIGSVKSIQVLFDKQKLTMKIPVIFEIEGKRIKDLHSGTSISGKYDYYQELIDKGLRARLDIESLVTGQLSIELGFHPDTPVKLVGIDMGYPEIPTIPSSLEEISKRIEKLPIQDLAYKVQRMVEGISQLVNSSDLQESIRTLNKTMNGLQRIVNNSEQHLLPAVSDIALTAREAQKVMKNLNVLVQNVQTLASNAESLVRESHGLIKNTSGLVTNTNKFVTNIDGEMDRLVRSFIKTSESAGATLKQTEKTLTAVESIASEDSPMRYELLTTLSELSDAARSIRLMAEYLERHPDALIYGKSGMRGGRR